MKQVVITGKLVYPDLAEPNDFNEKYETKICDISEEDLKKLKDAGIPQNINEKGCPLKYGKGKYKNQKGEEVQDPCGGPEDIHLVARSSRQPTVMDSSKNKMKQEAIAKISTGTVARVAVKPFEWKSKTGQGISAGLEGVMVIDLVEYTGDPFSDIEAVDGGYVSEETVFEDEADDIFSDAEEVL